MQSDAIRCRERLGEVILGARTPDPGTVRIVVATITTLGLNVAAYETCKSHLASLSASPASEFDGDVFNSEDGSFSVTLPELSESHRQPAFEISRTASGSWENATFVPKQDGSPIYGVNLDRRLSPEDASMSTSQYADKLLDSRMQVRFDTVSGVVLEELHREEVVIGGGVPAVADVFGINQGARSSAKSDMQAAQDFSGYLIYYVVKTKNMSAVLSVIWHGECKDCAAQTESQIRKSIPGMATFVDSFRLSGNRPTRQ